MSNEIFMFSDEDVIFDRYEGIPVGTHPATIQDIYVEENKATLRGCVDRFHVIFTLHDMEQEFHYTFDKREHDYRWNRPTQFESKYRAFVRMLGDAFAVNQFKKDGLVGQDVVITIELVPMHNRPLEKYVKITSLKKGGAVVA